MASTATETDANGNDSALVEVPNNSELASDKLPFECWEEIFTYFDDDDEKDNAELVCKCWAEVLSRNLREQRYLINGEYHPYFHEIAPIFANSNRRIVDYKFVNVDLKYTENFWKNSSHNIRRLLFEKCLVSHQVFINIVKSGIRLKKLALNKVNSPFRTMILFDFCSMNNAHNDSVEEVQIVTLDVDMQEMTAVKQLITLVKKVFPGIKTLLLSGNFVVRDVKKMLPAFMKEMNMVLIICDLATRTKMLIDPFQEVSLKGTEDFSVSYYENHRCCDWTAAKKTKLKSR